MSWLWRYPKPTGLEWPKSSTQSPPALGDLLDRVKTLRRAKPSFYFFLARGSRPYTADGFKSSWRKLKERAGVDVPFQGLRRKAAKDIEREFGRKAAQMLLAHTSETTTDIYLDEGENPSYQVELVR